MGKYIPPEKMTVEQIQANLDERFQVWNYIAQNGCSDPGWPDGVNMNLVRNHIIYYYGLLHKRQAAQVQISLFDIPARTPERTITWWLDVNTPTAWTSSGGATSWCGGRKESTAHDKEIDLYRA